MDDYQNAGTEPRSARRVLEEKYNDWFHHRINLICRIILIKCALRLVSKCSNYFVLALAILSLAGGTTLVVGLAVVATPVAITGVSVASGAGVFRIVVFLFKFFKTKSFWKELRKSAIKDGELYTQFKEQQVEFMPAGGLTRVRDFIEPVGAFGAEGVKAAALVVGVTTQGTKQIIFRATMGSTALAAAGVARIVANSLAAVGMVIDAVTIGITTKNIIKKSCEVADILQSQILPLQKLLIKEMDEFYSDLPVDEEAQRNPSNGDDDSDDAFSFRLRVEQLKRVAECIPAEVIEATRQEVAQENKNRLLYEIRMENLQTRREGVRRCKSMSTLDR